MTKKQLKRLIREEIRRIRKYKLIKESKLLTEQEIKNGYNVYVLDKKQNIVYEKDFERRAQAITHAEKISGKKYDIFSYSTNVAKKKDGNYGDPIWNTEDIVDKIDYLYFKNRDGSIEVALYKNGSKWIEGEIISGNKEDLPGWGSKTYQSYLKPKDIEKWLNRDYGLNLSFDRYE